MPVVNRPKRRMDQGIIDERRIENVVSKFWRILIVSVCMVSFVALGTAFAQKEEKFESKNCSVISGFA